MNHLTLTVDSVLCRDNSNVHMQHSFSFDKSLTKIIYLSHVIITHSRKEIEFEIPAVLISSFDIFHFLTLSLSFSLSLFLPSCNSVGRVNLGSIIYTIIPAWQRGANAEFT
jgi:hypothetical protein